MTELNVEFFSKELERLSVLENKYTDAWLEGLNGTKKFDRPTMKVLRDNADFYQNAAAYVRNSLLPTVPVMSIPVAVEVPLSLKGAPCAVASACAEEGKALKEDAEVCEPCEDVAAVEVKDPFTEVTDVETLAPN